MDRVTDFESGGCAFDPHRGHLPFNPQWKSFKVTFVQIERLEHIPTDPIYAQCASGIRGAHYPKGSKALKLGE